MRVLAVDAAQPAMPCRISVFALSAWLGLAAFYREKRRRIALEEQLHEQGLAAGGEPSDFAPVEATKAAPR